MSKVFVNECTSNSIGSFNLHTLWFDTPLCINNADFRLDIIIEGHNDETVRSDQGYLCAALPDDLKEGNSAFRDAQEESGESYLVR